MKLAGFFLVTILLQNPLSGKSQTLTLSGKDLPIKEIFVTIKSQVGVVFFYDAAVLRNAKRVTIESKNVTLETALNEIFKDQPFTWILEGKTVTIFKRPAQTILVEAALEYP